MEIINTKRGGKKIIFENFVYVKQKLVKVGVRWNCVKKSKNNENSCQGSITTDESIKVIISTTDHNHSACPVEAEVAKTLSLMKNNVKNHSEPPYIIFSKATINLSNEAKLLMPAENNIKRCLRRVKNASYPPLVPINELKVTGIWATTGGENPQPFLLYDNQNNENRIIIFSSPESLELLRTSKYWYTDGTFSTAPTGFNQVYIIHVKMGSVTVPLVYILIQNKTKTTYTEMLSVICAKCPNCEVVQITIDIEKAVVLAIEKVLPKVKIH